MATDAHLHDDDSQSTSADYSLPSPALQSPATPPQLPRVGYK